MSGALLSGALNIDRHRNRKFICLETQMSEYICVRLNKRSASLQFPSRFCGQRSEAALLMHISNTDSMKN